MMDLNKIKKQLDKIQRTVAFLSEEDELSQVEKDLLLEYVKALYATISDQSVAAMPEVDMSAPEVEAPVEEVVEETEEEEIIEEEEVEEEPQPEIPEELKTIFELREATELSDKLSLSPIQDLTKAMSINERIFTVNELFNGDQAGFQHHLSAINQLGDYQEAVDYIGRELALPFDWADASKIKKAEKFMLLVQRRFTT